MIDSKIEQLSNNGGTIGLSLARIAEPEAIELKDMAVLRDAFNRSTESKE